MRRLTVLFLGVALALALAPTQSAAAKKCKKGQAVLVSKGKKRCVKKCPPGMVKKKAGRTVRCVRPAAGEQVDPAPESGNTGDPGTTPAPAAPAFDPLVQYTDILRRMHLLRNYQVPKPGGGGTNNHSEEYAWCNHAVDGRIMAHYYEGIAYIYKSAGRYSIISGEASQDGAEGTGVIRYTQESANFEEERGKTLDIQVSWQGDVATVVHPEIGTYQFAKSVRSSESCG